MTAPRPAGPPPSEELPPPPSVGERYGRHPFGIELWMGIAILVVYGAIALGAMVEFRGSLAVLSENQAWIPDWIVIGPSSAHPFGILSGFGVDLLDSIWQATPWDLAIVFGILAIDGLVGTVLGAVAGFSEGRWPDAVITFVADSLGSIPGVFLVLIVFVGIVTLDPALLNLWLFVVLFGLVLCPTVARTVRERVRVVTHLPYVESARAAGAPRVRIVLRHILPNSLSPVLAQLPADVAAIFFVLTFFPWFTTCGGPQNLIGETQYIVPTLPSGFPLPSVKFPEWGFQLAVGACEGISFPGGPFYWWMIVFPLVAIVGLGLGIGFVCDGLDKWLRDRV